MQIVIITFSFWSPMVLDFLAINVLSKEYNSIRITDIAKKANISVDTVYLYFHSKVDIATTLVHERNEILTKIRKSTQRPLLLSNSTDTLILTFI